jgi:UDP-N-acetylmuramyl pentapeptide synthase
MSKLADLIQLFREIPGGHRIFLRREYDRLGSSYRMLARIYRQTFLARTRIVAVVGSLGKTTTRRALQSALDCPERNFSFSNYGSSLAGNLLRVRRGDRHAVLEVGIAGPDAMDTSARMIRPDLVIVTSIKSEHNRSFPTLLDTRAEKVKMVRSLPKQGIAILNGDDPNVRWMATQTAARVITFGLNPDNDLRAENVSIDATGSAFDVRIGGATHRIHSKLLGDHMLYPLLAAVAAAQVEKIELAGVIARLAQLPPATSRMELITLPDGTRILDDSSKGAVESMHAAFETFSRIPAARKIVVLGNVEEPPGKERDVYRELGNRLARCADLVVCIGDDNMTSLRAAATQAGLDRSAIRLAGSRLEAGADALNEVLRPGDLVLIKGASTQRLRRIVLELLKKKVSCRVKHCNVKVMSCDDCPLLDAPEAHFKNHFVERYAPR